MYEVIKKENIKIENMFYSRGQQVLVDSDLAKLYGTKTNFISLWC